MTHRRPNSHQSSVAESSSPWRCLEGRYRRIGVLPAASLTLILGSLEPLPQNRAQCCSLAKYTLYSAAHNVKRPNHKLPSTQGFPIYTAGVCCSMLEPQGRPGSASGLAGGAGVHEVRVKACLTGAHLVPWKSGNGLMWLGGACRQEGRLYKC